MYWLELRCRGIRRNLPKVLDGSRRVPADGMDFFVSGSDDRAREAIRLPAGRGIEAGESGESGAAYLDGRCDRPALVGADRGSPAARTASLNRRTIAPAGSTAEIVATLFPACQ